MGDLFLYVTVRDGALRVEFIDPDAPGEPPPGEPPLAATAGGGLAAIALDARGTQQELELLESRLAALRGAVEQPSWRERKDTVLALTGLQDFWRSPDRFEILGQYEYQGRIEAGVRRTASLLERLRRRSREQLPTHLLASVAQTLRLLEQARADVEQGRPHAAFLEVEGGLEIGRPAPHCDEFAAELGRMYLGWAERRHMRAATLEERPGGERLPYRLRLAVSGFGACSILAWEHGVHVLETPRSGPRDFERSRARVRVVPQRGDPGDGSADALRAAALAALGAEEGGEPRIVRRYRAEPSPLVRDGVRGWRSGRLDRVLAGDFDLIAEL
jgi:ATP-dependent Clp protease ATP-binding subunit ClpC